MLKIANDSRSLLISTTCTGIHSRSQRTLLTSSRAVRSMESTMAKTFHSTKSGTLISATVQAKTERTSMDIQLMVQMMMNNHQESTRSSPTWWLLSLMSINSRNLAHQTTRNEKRAVKKVSTTSKNTIVNEQKFVRINGKSCPKITYACLLSKQTYPRKVEVRSSIDCDIVESAKPTLPRIRWLNERSQPPLYQLQKQTISHSANTN